MAKARLSRKAERALEKYRGHDRSVSLGGVIAPPTKNAAKTAFASANIMRNPRLDTSIQVKSLGNVVHVPGIYG
jgi:hypothetical protein